MEKGFAPVSSRLIAYFSLIILFLGTAGSVVLKALQVNGALGDQQYLALIVLGFGVALGLISLGLAKDISRLLIYVFFIPFIVFIPLNHLLPAGSDPYNEIFLRSLALNLVSMVLLVVLIFGPSKTPLLGIGRRITNPFIPNQLKVGLCFACGFIWMALIGDPSWNHSIVLPFPPYFFDIVSVLAVGVFAIAYLVFSTIESIINYYLYNKG